MADGVDVISMSLGAVQKTLLDPEAIASFNAARQGIVVVAAAGNDGPGGSTLSNVPPWMLTVGSSSMNRQFPAIVVLGDGQTFVGSSLYPGDPHSFMKSLILADSAGSAYCEIGKLDASKVAGKIVLCRGGKVGSADKGVAVDKAGGSGVIIVGQEHDGEYVRAIAHLIPGTIVPFAAGKEIIGYVGSTPYPVCKILFFGTLVGGSSPPAPRIATTSSRGPSIPAPGILKPDLIAPGVNILAAWSGVSSPTKLAADTRRVEFNIISGTSMACPHVSGIAALLKKARPSWSPAMIMSALMTTAYGTDNAGDEIGDMATGKAAGPFELGAGHVDPNSALDPGLVYDAGEDDYIDFMCSIKASSPYNCSTRVSITGAELNRPSFSVKFKAYGENITLQRTVRNVGSNVDAVYTVGKRTGFPPGTRLIISPGKLVFDAEHQTRTYTIVFQSTLPPGNFTEYTHGSIVWSDGVHNVRSPIAVTWPFPTAALSVM
uniref:Subtilisin-like protease fibronectin type-III domain-containing protein n=1 Tax=Oryza brachyantha TaxID=4533 RepID=J3LHN4_ORYBR